MFLIRFFGKFFVCFLVIFIGNRVNSQVSLATTYFESFGTTDITTWTNNSTVAGWYGTMSGAFVFAHVNVGTGAPTNTGRMYSYECSSDDDQKIGSRASSGTGTIRYGVRLTNSSGSDIDFLLIEFDWYQFSLAQNGSNANTITFAYRQAATVTSLTTGAFTAVPALDFTAPMSSAISGTSQIEGYPCTQGGTNSYCLEVHIPAGEEIMLRWTDVDDGDNDHHMGIDNLFVGIATDSTCAFILPVQISNFNAVQNGNSALITWMTLSESNNAKFMIDRSYDGQSFVNIGSVNGGINSSTAINYSFLDTEKKGTFSKTYYQLRQIDLNGAERQSLITSLNNDEFGINYYNQNIFVTSTVNAQPYHFKIYNLSGQLLYDNLHSGSVEIPWNTTGIFIAEIPENGHRVKLVCQ